MLPMVFARAEMAGQGNPIQCEHKLSLNTDPLASENHSFWNSMF